MQDRPLILGIHGLANKPPREEKQKWWGMAIAEGLRRNAGRAPETLPFEFVYWADLRYDTPLTETTNLEPYYAVRGKGPFPTPEGGDPLTLTDRLYRVLEWLQDKAGRQLVDDLIIEYRLDDLWGYYKDIGFREAARDRLREALAAHAGRPLLIAAHSMGSLIAYDVLRLMERRGPLPSIAHLVTMGAPLGLAEVKQKIESEHGSLAVPRGVARWTNLGDREDVATVGALLSESYAPNADGVAVVDRPVVNAYRRPKGGTNHHKSYGYLRTPEFSRAVAEFLEVESSERRTAEAEASA